MLLFKFLFICSICLLCHTLHVHSVNSSGLTRFVNTSLNIGRRHYDVYMEFSSLTLEISSYHILLNVNKMLKLAVIEINVMTWHRFLTRGYPRYGVCLHRGGRVMAGVSPGVL